MEQKRRTEVRRQSFLHGAFILIAAIIIEKIIGALFKIPLAWILTPVGMGYFTTAFSLYSPLFSLSTAGFPITISRLVSENYVRGRFRDIRQIHRVSIRIFLFLGLLSFSIMFFGARPYANYTSSHPENALAAIYALAPAAFFASMLSIYRGYYEGLRNMYPTAISEVIEALCKLLFGLTAAYVIVNSGLKEYAADGTVYGIKMQSAEYAKMATLPYAAAGAIFGVTLGGFIAFIFLLIYHKKNGDGISDEMLRLSPRPMPRRATTARLVRTAIPIALGSLAVNMSTLVDSTFLQGRIGDVMASDPDVLLNMYKGVISESAIKMNLVPAFMYGCYGNAITLFMFVPAMTQAFGVSALPNVTEAWTEGNHKKIKRSIESVLRIVGMITVPAGAGLAVFAMPIASMMYENNGPEIIGKVLSVLGIAAIFSATSTPVNSMLQAIGRVDLPVKILAIGLAVKVVLNYTLVGIPEINVMGASYGTLACYVIIMVLALYKLCREAKVKINFVPIFLKPLLASALSIGPAYFLRQAAAQLISGKIATCAAILIAVVLYIFFMLKFKALNRRDVQMLPHGEKIAKILEKHNWIS
jgi:stage V sporulation protein B